MQKIAQDAPSDPQEMKNQLQAEFQSLVEWWQRDTKMFSSLEQIVLHPAYQQIIGMGKDALPLILQELQRTRSHWLWALNMIHRKDEAKPGQTFKEAAEEWLRWGEKMGYI